MSSRSCRRGLGSAERRSCPTLPSGGCFRGEAFKGALLSANYDLSYQGNNLTITKALLNVIADAKTKVYGDADPSLTYQVSGLKNGDTAGAVLNGGSLSRVAGENVGVYGINQGDLALNSGNYDLSYQGNNLTITKALLNVIADAKTKVYGDADPAQKHTQRLADTYLPQFASYVEPSPLYQRARRLEKQLEFAPFPLKLVAKATAWDVAWNPARPLPPVGGLPRLHGIEPREEDVGLQLGERVGHTLVLGTTRVGKTRLAELFITQDIRRTHFRRCRPSPGARRRSRRPPPRACPSSSGR